MPEEWEHAKVKTIFKKVERQKPINYRPGSLTCIVCKDMNPVIWDQIINHLKEYNLFSYKQFGFIIGHSTVLQILLVLRPMDKYHDNCGSGNIYTVILRKHFTNPSYIVTLKDKKGKIQKWIKAFLSDRM